jgi:hypothetical protein
MSDVLRSTLFGAAFFSLVLAGCAHWAREQVACCGPHPTDAPAETVLPAGRRAAILPNADRLPPFALLDETLKRERAASLPYRTLSAREAQCLAAQASPIANLLDRKADECMQVSGGVASSLARSIG